VTLYSGKHGSRWSHSGDCARYSRRSARHSDRCLYCMLRRQPLALDDWYVTIL